jgi:hypothetical protein
MAAAIIELPIQAAAASVVPQVLAVQTATVSVAPQVLMVQTATVSVVPQVLTEQTATVSVDPLRSIVRKNVRIRHTIARAVLVIPMSTVRRHAVALQVLSVAVRAAAWVECLAVVAHVVAEDKFQGNNC